MAVDGDRIDSGCGLRGAVCLESAATKSGKQRGGQIERIVDWMMISAAMWI